MISIGTVLREARLQTGTEQQELARVLGVSPFTLNRVERGHQPFRDEWLDRLPSDIRRPVAEALAVYYRGRAEEVGGKAMRRRTAP